MKLLCGKCGRTLRIDEAEASETVRCSHCGHVIRVPFLDCGGPSAPAAGPAEPQHPPASDDAGDRHIEEDFLTKAKLSLQKKLLIVCGSCGERLTVEQRLGGRVLRCPACGGPIRIPALTEEEPDWAEVLPADAGEEMEVLDAAAEDAAGPVRAVKYAPAAADAEGAAGSKVGLVLLLSAAAGLAGMLIGYILWGPREGKTPEKQPITQRLAEPATGPDGRPGSTTKPAIASTTKPAVRPGPQPVAPKVRAEVKVLQVRTEVLTAGLVPAPPSKEFLYVTVSMSAGREALNFAVGGDAKAAGNVAVVLDTEGGEIFPLGLAATGGAVPLAARAGAVTIPPAGKRVETFVFIVPEGLTDGGVTIPGLGSALLPPLRRTQPIAGETVAGSWAEAGRRLRVAFEDPVMERLRASSLHRLVITKLKIGFVVTAPPTGLRGMARPAGKGTCTAILTDGQHHLNCRLRLADSGKRLILYLADEPFHQVVYEKQQ